MTKKFILPKETFLSTRSQQAACFCLPLLSQENAGCAAPTGPTAVSALAVQILKESIPPRKGYWALLTHKWLSGVPSSQECTPSFVSIRMIFLTCLISLKLFVSRVSAATGQRRQGAERGCCRSLPTLGSQLVKLLSDLSKIVLVLLHTWSADILRQGQTQVNCLHLFSGCSVSRTVPVELVVALCSFEKPNGCCKAWKCFAYVVTIF